MTKPIIVRLPLGPIQTNCYILGCPTTGRAAVIDPSFSGRTIVHALEEKELTLTHILLTHAHFDHVGALGELKEAFPEVPAYVHPEASEMLDHAADQARLFGMNIVPPPKPERHLAEGDRLQIGELVLEVLYTPGHAPGHVSFYLPAGGVIFSGDVLFQGSIGRTDLPGGDFRTLIDVIHNKLLALPDDTQVLSGHGPETTIGQERRQNPFLQD